MPRSTYTAPEFLINVGNLVKNNTELKRKVVVRFLDTNWESRYIRIAARTIFYAKQADDTYGVEIKSLGRPEVYITAAQQWVDIETGELLRNVDGTFMTETEIQEKELVTGIPINYNYEFDFFDQLAGTPQVVKALITNYVNTAFESGKYDV